ncbi:hypothetical protein [Bradyrhizobium sp. SZCCHNS3002]|uniref:hypothetical protein n=1 Tax=Bradyrhizobium sp. SZCCHNS3002 TaxID=3057310 RepID=UPI0028E86399|nr:hypothetical protein [Bradyrhizobium sp. SZCCHNS3002]
MIKARPTLHRYTVRETSPQLNTMELGEPIYWHWSVEAHTPAEAIDSVRCAKTGGLDPQIVPPLG